MTDQELIRRYAKRQNEAAFRTLVERHAGMVFGVALRRTRDQTLAEEIAQNVFVQLARKSASLSDPGRVVGWLYRSAMLETSQALRKRLRETRKRRAYAREREVCQAKESGESEIPGAMDEALGELPPRAAIP